MKHIDGYVFIPRFLNHGIIFEPLFGPNTGKNKNKSYDNLENNGFTTFDKYVELLTCSKTYLEKMSDCNLIGYGRLKMDIAEKEEELDYFKYRSNLVVIMKSGDFQGERLIGPYTEGVPGLGAIPGGFLIGTNFDTFTFENSIEIRPIDRAKYVASEVHRQGQCGTTIATFNLRRFKKVLER